MMSANKARVHRHRLRTQMQRGTQLKKKKLNSDRLRQSRSRARGSCVGDDLVEAFEEMAKHLRGEIELEGLHPVNTTYYIACAHEMICPLICKLMGKRHDGYGSIGSRATPALDCH
jgi:hypothetical protein